jgi:hypothetical protein
VNANILFAFLEISHTILPHKCVTRALDKAGPRSKIAILTPCVGLE